MGSERYTPYAQTKQPAELLTIANHILGKGQLSLAKFLFITADDQNKISASDPLPFLKFVLERIDLSRDLHFYTHTSIDTLDYSGTGLNMGSKIVLAAYGEKLRELLLEIPSELKNLSGFTNATMAMPGVAVLQTQAFTNYNNAAREMENLNQMLKPVIENLNTLPLIVIADDAEFLGAHLNNFLWVSFTRCNPSHDIYGIDSFTQFKHWGCNGPLIIDARSKPHHAPALEKDPVVEKNIERLFNKSGSLYNMLK